MFELLILMRIHMSFIIGLILKLTITLLTFPIRRVQRVFMMFAFDVDLILR